MPLCTREARSGESLHHFLLLLGRLGHDVVVFHLRRGQVKLIGGFDVSNFAEQVHQLRGD